MEQDAQHLFDDHSEQLSVVRKNYHDLKNDLTKILGKLDVIELHYAELKEKSSDDAKRIRKLEDDNLAREAKFSMLKYAGIFWKFIGACFILLLLIVADDKGALVANWFGVGKK
jgi:hypothetical protein